MHTVVPDAPRHDANSSQVGFVIGMFLVSKWQGEHDRVLSIGSDHAIFEWCWRTGQITNQIVPPSRGADAGTVSAASYHAETSTVALGTDDSSVYVVKITNQAGNTSRCALEPAAVTYVLRDVHGPQSAPVVSIQHDADKLVSVGRDGRLRMSLIRPSRRENDGSGDPFTIEPYAAPWHDYEERGAGGETRDLINRWYKDVRFFVSTVVYEGGTVVHDGLDNMLRICRVAPL